MPPRPATKSDANAAPPSPPPDGTGGATALPPAPNAVRNSHCPQSAADTAKVVTAAQPVAPETAVQPAVLAAEAPAPPSDEALMQALCNGDDHALAPLMRRWEVPVKGFLLRLGVPSADVEDIAQEAFVRLYIKRSAYRAGAAFKPWLLTLAANLGRNRLRWRLRRRESSIEALFERSVQTQSEIPPAVGDDSAPPPSLAAEQSQRRHAVRAVIDALPAKLRSAVVCVDLEGLSHAEAACVLGCTAKAVENRVRRARERIRTGCAVWLAEENL